MKRTLLAVGIAVLISMLLVPYGRIDVVGGLGEPRWFSPLFWPPPDHWYHEILWIRFYAQTAFVTLLAVVLVNILPHRPGTLRMLFITVAAAIAILLVIGFSLHYFTRRPASVPQPRLKAADKDFRQLDLALIEPYDFTMNFGGWGEGWIRNKASDQIDALDIRVEIKNFAGDTIISQSHTVFVSIPPGQAAPIHFQLSQSPTTFGLRGTPSDNTPLPHDVTRWSWRWYVEAAGTRK
jgi:hypothetical protein